MPLVKNPFRFYLFVPYSSNLPPFLLPKVQSTLGLRLSPPILYPMVSLHPPPTLVMRAYIRPNPPRESPALPTSTPQTVEATIRNLQIPLLLRGEHHGLILASLVALLVALLAVPPEVLEALEALAVLVGPVIQAECPMPTFPTISLTTSLTLSSPLERKGLAHQGFALPISTTARTTEMAHYFASSSPSAFRAS